MKYNIITPPLKGEVGKGLLALLLLASCNGSTTTTEDKDSLNIVEIEELPSIIEAQGTVGDGTTMNVMEFVSANGDTTMIEVPGGQVLGSVSVGDEVSVVYSVTETSNIATLAINLTALQHLWNQRGADGKAQSLELNSGGRAATYDMKTMYTSWECKSGQLILHQPRKVGSEAPEVIDTFQILQLTPDTLVLEKDNVITIFECDN